MAEDIRIWEILNNERLSEIKKAKLDLEDRLEQWIEDDISIISQDLIIIGRQVETVYGGYIDLLCLDVSGDVVIIELKRDKTPRDITAQVLDYAAWVKDLSNDNITEIANAYLEDKSPLENAFKVKFDEELPEILNENHKMLIVASEIDTSAERIINYLSDSYGVAINAISFQYFKSDKEYLARAFLLEPSEVDRKSKTKRSSKRKPPLTLDELKEIADSKEVGQLFEAFDEEIQDFFDNRFTTRSTLGWSCTIEGKMNTILNISPKDSNKEDGLFFYVYIDRLSDFLNTPKEEIIKILPENTVDYKPWQGAPTAIAGNFKSIEDIRKFSEGLKSLK